MNDSVVSAFIVGVAITVMCIYVSVKIRNYATDSDLEFGSFLVVLAWFSLGIPFFVLYASFFNNNACEDRSELFSIFGLFIFFGCGAIYLFGEYFGVRGKFDEEKIEFYSPWSGKKSEEWSSLAKIKYNSILNWYVLEFKSGTKIRLSIYLNGFGNVTEFLRKKGHF